jgi:WhiB family redox-sensing transcriptional regulator
MFRNRHESEIPDAIRRLAHEGRGTVHGSAAFVFLQYTSTTEHRYYTKETGMSSAIAFASERAFTDELADLSGIGVGELLDTVASPDLGLPCRSGNADLWFAESPADLERAKRFCADCPVREACLAGAIARREPWGVWGGEIFERGVVVPRKRPRGRPRKNPVERPIAEQRGERAAEREQGSAAA